MYSLASVARRAAFGLATASQNSVCIVVSACVSRVSSGSSVFLSAKSTSARISAAFRIAGICESRILRR